MKRFLCMLLSAVMIASCAAPTSYAMEIQNQEVEIIEQEAVTEEAVTEEAVTEEAVTEETVTEEAVTEEPVTEETTQDETVIDEFETAEAFSGSCGPNAVWEFEGSTLTISGKGPLSDYENGEEQPYYAYKQQIKKVVIEEGITYVGSNAFCAYSIEELVLPESLVRVGDSAFADYAGEELILPSSLKCVERRAFAFSNNLIKDLKIPASLVEMDPTAFGSCAKLENFVVDPQNPKFESEDGVIYTETENGKCLYLYPAGKNWFEDYYVEDTVKSIGEYAFWGSRVGSISGMENVSVIGNRAFWVCEALQSIELSDTLEKIGKGAFENCSSLTNLIYYGSSQDWQNVNIESANEIITNANIAYKSENFYSGDLNQFIYWSYNIAEKTLFVMGEPDDDWNDVDIPAMNSYPWDFLKNEATRIWVDGAIKSIGNGAFKDFVNVDFLHITPAMVKVGDDAFSGCKSLKTLEWTSKWSVVDSIGARAFKDCSSLDQVYLSGTIKNVGVDAFKGTDALQVVFFGGTQKQWNSIKYKDAKNKWGFTSNPTIIYEAKSGSSAIGVADENGNAVNEIKVGYFGDRIEVKLYTSIYSMDGGSGSVNVSSSDTSVANIWRSNGNEYTVDIRGIGTATLTFTDSYNRNNTKTITVTSEEKATDATVTLGKNITSDGTAIFIAGESFVPTINWKNGASWGDWEIVIPEVAEGIFAWEDGKVVAKGTGEAVLTFVARESGNYTMTVDVPCKAYGAKTAAIEVSAAKVILDPMSGERTKLISAKPSNEGASNAFEITWTDAANIKFEIENEYTVKATALNNTTGSAVVTFKALDGTGKTAKATVSVGVGVEAVELIQVPESVAVGKSVKATAAVVPEHATEKGLIWVSENPEIATVSNGTIKGIAPGTARIVVTAKGGTGAEAVFDVLVAAKAEKVVLMDGVKTVKMPFHEAGDQLEIPVRVIDKEGNTENVRQKVDVTLGGAIASDTDYTYDAERGILAVFPQKAGKLTITAVSTDGTNKKATLSLNVEQHVNEFDVVPPKNVAVIYENTWVVTQGTTITPQAIYNLGDKAKAPASAVKGFEILAEYEEVVINQKKGTIKISEPGEYPVKFVYEEPCGERSLQEAAILRVIPKNSVDLSYPEIVLPATVQDEKVAAGSSVQLTAYLNGLKASGAKLEWFVEAMEQNTGSATISKSGKLELKKAAVNDQYRVVLVLTDKVNPENTKQIEKVFEVTEKLVKTDIQLLTVKDQVSITTVALTPESEAVDAAVSVGNGKAFDVKSSSASILTVEANEDGTFRLTPKGTGTATLTVTVRDGSNVKQTVKVKVNPVSVPVKQINVSGKTFYMSKQTPISVTYGVVGNSKTGADATYPSVLWTVSDASKMRLTEDGDANVTTTALDGVITFYPTGREGKVTVTGTALDGSKKTVKITLTIVNASKGQVTSNIDLRLPANTADGGEIGTPVLTWGKSLQLKTYFGPKTAKNKNVIYQVTDQNGDVPAGVTIAKGKVTVAKASKKLTPYTGWITVKAMLDYTVDGKEIADTQRIYVQAPVEKIVIKGSNQAMTAGDSRKFEAEITFNAFADGVTYKNVLWSVSDSKIAKISDEGVLTIKDTAKKGKTVKVTADAQDGSGKKATITIKIQ